MSVTTSLAGKARRREEDKPYKAINPDYPRLAIKHDAAFLLTDVEGMMPSSIEQGLGFFRDDTRWLSQWQISLNGKPLFLLNGNTNDGYAANFVYSNPELPGLPKQTIMVERDIVINDEMTERIVVRNFSEQSQEITMRVRFGADFADMFEVRGQRRQRRGTLKAPIADSDRRRVTLGYIGLDGIERETMIDILKQRPLRLTGQVATFKLTLASHETRELLFHVSTRKGGGKAAPSRPTVTYEQERTIADARYRGFRDYSARIVTGNDRFNDVLEQAELDLYVLVQGSERGRALAAGVPWFAVPFGRDDLITALQTVAFKPELARDILRYFATWQGTKSDEELAEEHGKMPHEIRSGEMANCGEIAFRPYYGTVDATQLWLMLLSQYVHWTGDTSLARELWSNAVAADGFLTRATRYGAEFITYGGTGALTNQGWKDSGNSIRYSDGHLAKAPIALCEAQGYLHAAWLGMAQLAKQLGQRQYAAELSGKAAMLKSRFEPAFWMEEKQFVALALDGDGRQCDVISSNPGHLLGTGILSKETEAKVVDGLMSPEMFTGWGIRTLGRGELAYQPMDYQLGAVWGHDTAYGASAFVSLGKPDEAHRVLKGLFEAAVTLGDNRLPELFCGFDRIGSQAPIRYPVACKPQAWSAGAWFHLLTGCLNLVPDARHNRLRIIKPSLPAWLGTVQVQGLRVGDAMLDLEFIPSLLGGTRCSITRQVGVLDVKIER